MSKKRLKDIEQCFAALIAGEMVTIIIVGLMREMFSSLFETVIFFLVIHFCATFVSWSLMDYVERFKASRE